jgi:hypothetical protein
MRVRIAVADDPTLRYGASLLVASWRDLGLRVRIVPSDKVSQGKFVRIAAPPRSSVSIAHAVDARFVSPRVKGWREDARGLVDYTRVTVR